MSDNAVGVALVVCLMGWIPILALCTGISWIVQAWR